MRVLHVIPSLSPTSGGPSFALPAMVRSLQPHEVQIVAATTDDDGPGRRLPGIIHGVETTQDGWSVVYFPKQTEFYKVSLPLRSWLQAHVHEFDVVHIHAVFSFASLVSGHVAAARGVPYIVRPLGVLNRWGMQNRRRLVKALSFRLFDLPMLKKAAAMHYTSRMELEDAARFGLTNIQRVIPIGIDLAPFDSLPPRSVFSARFPETAATRNLLFLSRIDEKKGLDLLIAAFAKVRPQQPDTRLIICGEGDPVYVAGLKQQAQELGISEHITWAGFMQGEMRLAAFAAAELFVLPSHSENFGIALLEAMAAGLPCISTDQVALAVEAAADGAVCAVACEESALSEAMRSLLGDAGERARLAKAAKQTAINRYSLKAMGAGLKDLYESVLRR
jgi:glycosyltransferase involved in cell wall biosynthesis|uniref:glycosyltransferase n=1 Tax=Prosthecobacter sp. TaxID=1965333 RepID=UPI003783221D